MITSVSIIFWRYDVGYLPGLVIVCLVFGPILVKELLNEFDTSLDLLFVIIWYIFTKLNVNCQLFVSV